MNKEKIIKGRAQIKNKWFETKEDELDIALNVIDDLLIYINQLETNREEAIEHIRTKTKIIPFNEESEGGGLELTDYDIRDLLEILERGKE